MKIIFLDFDGENSRDSQRLAGLGMTSGEIIECLLPEDCSDQELLEYPGFNVVRASH